MRGWRAAAALTAGMAVMVLLTSCTPENEPIVGLAVRDGRPVMVVVSCPGSSSEASVHELDGVPAGPSSGADDLPSWSVDADTPQQVTEIPLFEPPPEGWIVQVDTLSSLQPGTRYMITGYAGRMALSVTFTVADLRRIGPDDVLVETADGRRGTTPQTSFVSWAADSCR